MSWSDDGDPDRVRRYRQRVFRERARLREALADPGRQQQDVLTDLLAANADTEFGRQYGFGKIRTAADFKAAVPIHDYAALEPWIERMAGGAHAVLTAEDPVVYFTSSGSTGAHKKVPVTRRFMRTSFFPFYYAAWAPMAEHFPDAVDRDDAVLNLKHDPRPAKATTASGRPHLGASQIDFGTAFGEPLSAEPGTAAPWSSLPCPVPADDHLEKAYVRLRIAAEHPDLRGLVGINPAMVAAVPYQLRMWWPRIVREIADGTVGGFPYGPGNLARARRLDRLDPVRPSGVWPGMQVLFCWTTGLAKLYLPRLREEFGAGVTVLPAPVAASEGPVGVALDRHGSAGSLVVTAAFYEFVPAEERIRPDSATLGPAELEAGREYHVVLSHVGGLVRYALGDVVRVLDTVGGSPRVEYAGRNTVLDAQGERLRESQVLRALGTALDAGGLEVRNAACHVDDGARYEFACAPRIPWSDEESGFLAARLDEALAAESPGYRAARAAGRLAPAVVTRIDGEAFLREWHAEVTRGVRPAQAKDRLLRRDDAAWQRLTDAATRKDDHGQA